MDTELVSLLRNLGHIIDRLSNTIAAHPAATGQTAHGSRHQPATQYDLLQLEKRIMALDTDLNDAVDAIITKNDALIALVGDLKTALENSNTTLPAAVQAAVGKLVAEAQKDDGVLNPPPPQPPTP